MPTDESRIAYRFVTSRANLHLVANRQLIHWRSIGTGFHDLGNTGAEIINGNLEERLIAQTSLFKPRDFQLIEAPLPFP